MPHATQHEMEIHDWYFTANHTLCGVVFWNSSDTWLPGDRVQITRVSSISDHPEYYTMRAMHTVYKLPIANQNLEKGKHLAAVLLKFSKPK